MDCFVQFENSSFAIFCSRLPTLCILSSSGPDELLDVGYFLGLSESVERVKLLTQLPQVVVPTMLRDVEDGVDDGGIGGRGGSFL